MDKENLKRIKKVIRILDAVSGVPFLVASTVYFIFFLQIAFDYLNWEIYFSNYFWHWLVGFLIYLYDRNVISEKIQNEKYEELLINTLCLGILGCFYFGLGVFLILKWVTILIYIIISYWMLWQNKVKLNYSKILRLSFMKSLNDFSSRGGFLIIFIYFMLSGSSFLFSAM